MRTSGIRYSGSRSSYTSTYKSSSSSYKSSYKGGYTSSSRSYNSYTPSYQSSANKVTRTNSYFSSSAAKTYKPLYQYYLPPNYYNSKGYYSTTYSMKYYDGYGYNFYYGDYGYYEYSTNPVERFSDNLNIVTFQTLFEIWCLTALPCLLFYKCYGEPELRIMRILKCVCYIPWCCLCEPLDLLIEEPKTFFLYLFCFPFFLVYLFFF
jgi:hypothetical protein